MRRLKSIFFVLVAMIWLPTTLHCELESLPGLEFLACPSEPSDESKPHCDDTCCSVERAAYKSEQVRQTIPLPELFAAVSDALPPLSDALTVNFRAGFSTALPPELPKRWQFLFRTASPPRAPSFAS